jgi:hypothetical protein
MTSEEVQHNPSRKWTRYNYAFGPVGAGLIIDAVDFVTFGPVGLALGFPVGAAAGYWLARSLRLETNPSLLCALIAGVYCTIPGTELLPLGTLVGALVRLEDVPETPPAPNSVEETQAVVEAGDENNLMMS